MNLLLDAHALLWFFAGNSRLSDEALAGILDTENTIFVSPATLWEISIKNALGKLSLPESFEELFPARLEVSNILILPILIPHLYVQCDLPFHHHDPFDRLLIAQALAEDFTVVSCDGDFLAYGVKLLW